jgi:hypothetical protein
MTERDSGLSIVATDANGRRFVLVVFEPEWVPLEMKDIGAPFIPCELLEVRRGDGGYLYTTPPGGALRR